MLSAAQIAHACDLCRALHASGTSMEHAIIEACNRVMSRSFDGLAVLTGSGAATLSRFVLPDDQQQSFLKILNAARSHSVVMHEWGFARHLATGKGLCILFDGAPGTGKTFAAEVIANELHRPLQRVDMSNLVSKWVGETGENIAKLFAAARTNDCGGKCVNLNDDATCGTSCDNIVQCDTGEGQYCYHGQCFCHDSRALCDNKCVDLSDASTCGLTCADMVACNVAENQYCDRGKCACPEGQTLCGEHCVILGTDDNCGLSCDDMVTCITAEGQSCKRGECVCPSGLILRDGHCIDPLRNNKYCGANDSDNV